MAFQVSKTCTNCLYIFFSQSVFSHTTIHLKGTKGCDNNNCIWRCWQVWCLDIKEFLSTKVRTKTSFSNSVISQVKGCCRRQNRVTAMSDIGKWTTVYKGRCTVNCLNQVWLNSILQNQSQGTLNLQITYRNRRTVIAITNNDIRQTTFQVLDVRCQAKNCHDF
ncbi:Uncharacterised protein [Streptococcus pneumoniae]|nr:Uncharacterised protein [Streptococcus pneumoniae]CIV67182.1 Uncharacterised protein [Streptococcus pneumoniae]CIV69904.1 Uncharacterised protein [Streptococcus pneumoniae]CIV82063.1 Uncharacterised protein [Streptococcus pneumoniae]CIV88115.1 Uncharacterised protein [Streptococcus pneumoniae]